MGNVVGNLECLGPCCWGTAKWTQWQFSPDATYFLSCRPRACLPCTPESTQILPRHHALQDCHVVIHTPLSPHGQKRIGHISASNGDRVLMFGSYERSLKALSEFYNLVAMATFSQKSLSPCAALFPPLVDKAKLVRPQLLMKIEHWCLPQDPPPPAEDKEDKEESTTLPARDFALQLPWALLLVIFVGVRRVWGRVSSDVWGRWMKSLDVEEGYYDDIRRRLRFHSMR